ncbi:MAG: carbohydrate-binding protein [Verrucomicrobia bacterium]|jgi:hypothetical protein|nr:carbohydrate-binding protein [Verrucomicrobiota bacterium]
MKYTQQPLRANGASPAQTIAIIASAMLFFVSAFGQSGAEAENYTNEFGTQLTQGGEAVGYINAGDYLGFDNFFLPPEFDSIEIDLAISPGASNPDDRIILTVGGQAGLKLASLKPASTGGWNNFETQTFNASVVSIYGGNTVDFYFNFEGSGYIADLDAFRFIKEAENYDAQSGTQLVENGDAVGYINAGDNFGYNDFTLPDDFDTIEINLAVPAYQNNSDDRIILTWGGPQGLKLAYLKPNATGGWSNYEKQQFNVGGLEAFAGSTADLYFTFEGTGYIVNIESFRFLKSGQ